MTPKNLNEKIIIRFDAVDEQVRGAIKRVIGFVQVKNLLQLLHVAAFSDDADLGYDLEANPRKPKIGPVTRDIGETISDSPELLPFKTKGLLVGASRYKALERNRYELTFSDPALEGILDGGHNALAIGINILDEIESAEDDVRKIKTWQDFQAAWKRYKDNVAGIVWKTGEDDEGKPPFVIPVEIIVPNNDSPENVDEFKASLLDICAARNNNVQLTVDTKAAKKGHFEEIRNVLPESLKEEVEWKSNEGGTIKVRDIVALAWVPLLRLKEKLPEAKAKGLFAPSTLSPQTIYGGKGECMRQFDALMVRKGVSDKKSDSPVYELKSDSVRSAIRLLRDLPKLHDRIYCEFPVAYNKGTGGKFGRIRYVKTGKKNRYSSKFVGTKTEYKYPDGYILPLVYALSELMEVDDHGLVDWCTDPDIFLDKHLADICKGYKGFMEALDFEPQKIGKSSGSYQTARREFELALLREKAAASQKKAKG